MTAKLFPFAIIAHFTSIFASAQSAVPLWGDLKAGPHKVGFRVTKEKDSNGKTILISTWYPAEKDGGHMTLKNYVETGLWNGKEDKASLADGFKETIELPFLFGIKKLSSTEFDNLLSAAVFATSGAEMKKGKWPLIIIDTEPASLCVTTEWLASNGFIVAVPSADFPPPVNDATLYKGPTIALEYLLNYMKAQSYVDANNISALGFGGGSMAAFYLAMKTKDIRSLVNIEGGIFMPLSKTTLSADYQPKRFTIPLLHVVRPEIIKGESHDESNAIASSQKYRVTIIGGTQHHDLTIYGRVVNAILHQRGTDASLATLVFTKTHELALEFLKKRELDQSDIQSATLFRLETF